MPAFRRRRLLFLIVGCALAALTVCVWAAGRVRAQNDRAVEPNSNPTYQALRNITLSGESISVSDVDLKRDAATFHLHSGTLCFLAPVQGKVTGAVFVGDGSLTLDAPAFERRMLNLLTKDTAFGETFSQMVLRFTDTTYNEMKGKGSPAAGGCDAGLLRDSQRTIRNTLRSNLDARILQDVLQPRPGRLFLAFIRGKHYNKEELFCIDPFDERDQVKFMTLSENNFGVWASFPMSGAVSAEVIGMPMHIEHQQLDTTLEANGNLTGKAVTTFTASVSGLRVATFDLFPTLRVLGVAADGQFLDFVQEDRDSQLAVILPRAMAADERLTITTIYTGRDAVLDEGNGDYYPVSRSNWFPNNPQADFGEFVSYDMTFRIPKGMTMAATGERLSENVEGSQDVTVWRSEKPQPAAGFNFGKFQAEESRLASPEYFLQSYTLADTLYHTGQDPRKALTQSQLAVQLYTDFFGPSLFKHLQLTQQTACNFGQSWPELVWIPAGFYNPGNNLGYWAVVVPHEVAHQWWGGTVGFNSYRDQWMSEGFAEMSAAMFLTVVDKDPRSYIQFWNDERALLLDRDTDGFRAIDAGPLTVGYRLSNSRTGPTIARRLIYPKGAYVLHMIRMMMHDNATGDEDFRELMRDFVRTYSGRAATTEDFKSMVGKHMTREMDLAGNHKMDWFFDEYVYGTQLPAYKAQASFEGGPEGTVVLNLTLTQSNVNDDFRMLIPLYLELSDGKIAFLARARIAGSRTVSQRIPLRGLTTKPRRLRVNYYDDVLASPGQ